jgi:hypothetical protein
LSLAAIAWNVTVMTIISRKEAKEQRRKEEKEEIFFFSHYRGLAKN